MLKRSKNNQSLFIGKISEMAEVAKTLMKKLKVRDKILEEPDLKTSWGYSGWRQNGIRVIICY